MSERSNDSRVFVSHSHQDNDFCRAFVAGLRKSGLTVWYDEHNLGWGQLRGEIDRELRSSAHFVAILSPAAVASDWVNMEIDAALALLRRKQLKTFVLALAHPCDVPVTLEAFRRLEGPGGAPTSVEEAVQRVVRIVQDIEPAPVAPIAADDASLPVGAQPVEQPRPGTRAPDRRRDSGASADASVAYVNMAPSPKRSDVRKQAHGGRLLRRWRIVGIVALLALLVGLTAASVQLLRLRQIQARFTHSAPYGNLGAAGTTRFVCAHFYASPIVGDSPTYSWNFGEPSSSENSYTGIEANHCYFEQGRYTVTLVARNAEGGYSVARQTIDLELAAATPGNQ